MLQNGLNLVQNDRQACQQFLLKKLYEKLNYKTVYLHPHDKSVD